MRVSDYYRSIRLYFWKFGVSHALYLIFQLLRARYIAPAGSLISITVPGLKSLLFLRARTTDARVFHQLFAEEELSFTADWPASFVVDAGAYTGLSSIYLARQFPNARIVALELDSSNYALLKKNTETIPAIVPIHKALWWRTAAVIIDDPSAEPWSYSASEATADCETSVEAVTLNDILRDFNAGFIDFLKMDIEGAEREVFSSNNSWLGQVRVLAVELHERKKPGCRASLDRAIEGQGFIQSQRGEYTVLVRACSRAEE